MRDANIYAFRRAMPRMSWHPRNLYNLWRRSLGSKKEEIDFRHTTLNLFQQRWRSKALVRAYHGDYINEKVFKRWYLPSTLPDVRPHAAAGPSVFETVGLAKWAKREEAAQKEEKRAENERRKGLAPVGSLMFTEVERRIDVIIFRACFSPSVYEARRLVIHGNVLLNGRKHSNPNTRLAPGDMVSVDPQAIRFLQADAAPKEASELDAKADADIATAEKAASSESEDAEEVTSEGAKLSEASSKAQPPRKEKDDNWPVTKHAKSSNLTPFHPPPYSGPFMFIPAYLEPSFTTCSVVYVRHPTARPGYSEVPTPYDADGEVVRAAWEWYSKNRPRMRSKSQLARMPENRQ